MATVVLAVLGVDATTNSAGLFRGFAKVVTGQVQCQGISAVHHDEELRSITFELSPGTDLDEVFASVMRAARTHALGFWDDRQVVLAYDLAA